MTKEKARMMKEILMTKDEGRNRQVEILRPGGIISRASSFGHSSFLRHSCFGLGHLRPQKLPVQLFARQHQGGGTAVGAVVGILRQMTLLEQGVDLLGREAAAG